MGMKLEFVALDDGINSRLTISGGAPGPHQAVVRAEPSGLGLAHLAWQHDHAAVCLVPVEHEHLVVTVDRDHEERLTVSRRRRKTKAETKEPKENAVSDPQNGPDVPTNASDPHNSGLPAPGVDLPEVPEPDVLPTADGHADSVDPPGEAPPSDQHQPEPRPTEAEEAEAGDAGAEQK